MSLLVTIRESASLKDKRSVIRGLVQAIGNRKGVGIAETGLRDSTKSAELTVAIVGDSPGYVDDEARKIIDDIESKDEATVLILRIEKY